MANIEVGDYHILRSRGAVVEPPHSHQGPHARNGRLASPTEDQTQHRTLHLGSPRLLNEDPDAGAAMLSLFPLRPADPLIAEEHGAESRLVGASSLARRVLSMWFSPLFADTLSLHRQRMAVSKNHCRIRRSHRKSGVSGRRRSGGLSAQTPPSATDGFKTPASRDGLLNDDDDDDASSRSSSGNSSCSSTETAPYDSSAHAQKRFACQGHPHGASGSEIDMTTPRPSLAHGPADSTNDRHSDTDTVVSHATTAEGRSIPRGDDTRGNNEGRSDGLLLRGHDARRAHKVELVLTLFNSCGLWWLAQATVVAPLCWAVLSWWAVALVCIGACAAWGVWASTAHSAPSGAVVDALVRGAFDGLGVQELVAVASGGETTDGPSPSLRDAWWRSTRRCLMWVWLCLAPLAIGALLFAVALVSGGSAIATWMALGGNTGGALVDASFAIGGDAAGVHLNALLLVGATSPSETAGCGSIPVPWSLLLSAALIAMVVLPSTAALHVPNGVPTFCDMPPTHIGSEGSDLSTRRTQQKHRWAVWWETCVVRRLCIWETGLFSVLQVVLTVAVVLVMLAAANGGGRIDRITVDVPPPAAAGRARAPNTTDSAHHDASMIVDSPAAPPLPANRVMAAAPFDVVPIAAQGSTAATWDAIVENLLGGSGGSGSRASAWYVVRAVSIGLALCGWMGVAAYAFCSDWYRAFPVRIAVAGGSNNRVVTGEAVRDGADADARAESNPRLSPPGAAVHRAPGTVGASINQNESTSLLSPSSRHGGGCGSTEHADSVAPSVTGLRRISGTSASSSAQMAVNMPILVCIVSLTVALVTVLLVQTPYVLLSVHDEPFLHVQRFMPMPLPLLWLRAPEWMAAVATGAVADGSSHRGGGPVKEVCYLPASGFRLNGGAAGDAPPWTPPQTVAWVRGVAALLLLFGFVAVVGSARAFRHAIATFEAATSTRRDGVVASSHRAATRSARNAYIQHHHARADAAQTAATGPARTVETTNHWHQLSGKRPHRGRWGCGRCCALMKQGALSAILGVVHGMHRVVAAACELCGGAHPPSPTRDASASSAVGHQPPQHQHAPLAHHTAMAFFLSLRHKMVAARQSRRYAHLTALVRSLCVALPLLAIACVGVVWAVWWRRLDAGRRNPSTSATAAPWRSTVEVLPVDGASLQALTALFVAVGGVCLAPIGFLASALVWRAQHRKRIEAGTNARRQWLLTARARGSGDAVANNDDDVFALHRRRQGPSPLTSDAAVLGEPPSSHKRGADLQRQREVASFDFLAKLRRHDMGDGQRSASPGRPRGAAVSCGDLGGGLVADAEIGGWTRLLEDAAVAMPNDRRGGRCQAVGAGIPTDRTTAVPLVQKVLHLVVPLLVGLVGAGACAGGAMALAVLTER